MHKFGSESESSFQAIESGLIDVWKQWTYTAMKEEYLQAKLFFKLFPFFLFFLCFLCFLGDLQPESLTTLKLNQEQNSGQGRGG